MSMRRVSIGLAVFVLLSLPSQASFGLEVVTTGKWLLTLDSTSLVGGAGTGFADIYESSATEVQLSINPTLLVNTWTVDVHRSDLNWHGDLTISAKRTSAGSGGSVSGGTTYREISTTSAYFFQGEGEVTDIDLQFKVQGVSVALDSTQYTSEIVYTVIE